MIKKMRVKGNKCPHSFGQRGRGEDGLIFEGLGGWYARRIFRGVMGMSDMDA